ncbi:U2 snRNP complex subunit IST3 Ecym_4467 [Eremothecium cymbalariae DBVPG|uniref:RRM domain-containing protein n=1 Tax=Eremothecium cymbalariae (strain CBS 270.75 / DBVPG 7215 / KCTC 17166 / NRRL Y-17582) TaxID=931890 RepID=G8JU04_ERECY|nr:hypothetical protein Ecym_4467 [Eremothecium cymbalariae DBVPG\
MNQIRSIQKLSDSELQQGILSEEASWHYQYKDQAYIHFSGLNLELTEGDILTIFSQFGVPTDLKLARDRDTGESRGFGYLKYEDQRSTILAVDNLNGAKICGRTLKVDHTFYHPRNEDVDYMNEMKLQLSKDVIREPLHKVDSELQSVSSKCKKEGNGDDDDFADPMEKFIKK